jgi:hypothetical protein
MPIAPPVFHVPPRAVVPAAFQDHEPVRPPTTNLSASARRRERLAKIAAAPVQVALPQSPDQPLQVHQVRARVPASALAHLLERPQRLEEEQPQPVSDWFAHVSPFLAARKTASASRLLGNSVFTTRFPSTASIARFTAGAMRWPRRMNSMVGRGRFLKTRSVDTAASPSWCTRRALGYRRCKP